MPLVEQYYDSFTIKPASFLRFEKYFRWEDRLKVDLLGLQLLSNKEAWIVILLIIIRGIVKKYKWL